MISVQSRLRKKRKGKSKRLGIFSVNRGFSFILVLDDGMRRFSFRFFTCPFFFFCVKVSTQSLLDNPMVSLRETIILAIIILFFNDIKLGFLLFLLFFFSLKGNEDFEPFFFLFLCCLFSRSPVDKA